MMKVLVDYPTEEEEFVIVERVTGVLPDAQGVAHGGTRDAAARMPARLRRALAHAIRGAPRGGDARPERFGIKGLGTSRSAQARAPPSMSSKVRALAFLRGRDYALPDDVTDLVPDVFRHRLVLSRGACRGPFRRRARQARHAARPRAGEAAGDACPRCKRITPRRSSGSTGR